MIDWLTDNSGTIITVVFFVAFVSISLWAYIPSNKNKLQDRAMIPFQEERRNG